MALAATKTWSFSNSIRAFNYQSTYYVYGYWMWDLKEFLVSLGWTVRGGYDPVNNVIYHNDGSNTDPWPAWNYALKAQYSSRDTYIILRSPAALGVEICFGSNYATSTSQAPNMFFYTSQGNYFGATESGANGTGGTSAVPPTASDQVAWYPHNSSTITVPTANSTTYSFYAATSADGKSLRLICHWGRATTFFFVIDHLANPHADMDDSGRVVSLRTGNIHDSNDTIMDNDYYTGTLFYGKRLGVARGLYAGTSGYANAGVQSHFVVADDNKMLVSPVDLYNNTFGEKGYYGTIPDMYYGNNGHYTTLLGDTVGGAANWFSGGSVITPWDPAEPLPRVK
jgi:hypothetical protein